MDSEDQDFRDQVRAFAEKYLYGALNEAGQNGENKYIGIFAMLECIFYTVPVLLRLQFFLIRPIPKGGCDDA